MGAIDVLTDFDDLAEAIANPNPDRPFENAVGGFGRAVCDRYSAVPSSFLVDAISPWDDLCGPYWDGQGYSPPAGVPPFQGGQCPGINYGVTITRANGNIVGNTLFARGPITELSVAQIGAFQYRVTLAGFTSGGAPTSSSTTVNVLSGEGAPTAVLRRVDGQPDSCGNPPDGPLQPGPNPAPDPGPLPPGTGPAIDIRGNPVLVLPPNLFVSPTVNVAVDVGEISFGNGGAGGGAPGGPVGGAVQPGVGSGAGGGDNPFGEPPDGERWVGCKVTLTEKAKGLGVIPSSIPNEVYAEVVGNARLKFSSGTVSGLDSPVQLRSEVVCLWEPVRGMQPTGAFVNLKPGFSYTVQPYSVPLED